MASRIIAVAVDCRDAAKLAAFWREALGGGELDRWRDGYGVTYVQLSVANRADLLFQPVPEDKVVKNRLHLDVAPTELDEYAEVDRLVSLGATVLGDDPAEHWVCLADPEGNEFCVLPRR